jgi:hypothetical protein
MGWVEELKPDDEVEVEIIYPPEYIEACMSTIRKYARGIACLCKGAATLGEDETEFLVWDMLIVQVITIEETMRQFGIEMTHESGKINGRRWTYFYADLTELRERMEDGEFDTKELD